MNVRETPLPGVLLIEPRVFGDGRGFFMEAYNEARYVTAGISGRFVQDNLSRSRHGVLRGIHLQHPNAQAKLVSVIEGEVFDVAVDLRIGSPTFGRWHGEYLSADNRRQLYLPAGFGHGFAVTSKSALFHYKCTDFYDAALERTIRWDDPRIGVSWPISEVYVSEKDRSGKTLDAIRAEDLPSYVG